MLFFLFINEVESNLLEEIKLKEPGSESPVSFMDSNHKDRIYILEAMGGEEPKNLM